MRAERPDPPVPADADLRHFSGMMVDVPRVLRSEFILSASKAGVGAAFLLWCSAWHEVPAGSLPENERILARLALCDWDEWQEVREEALNDYVLCSDGRYHHTTGAVVVLEALDRTKKASIRGKKGATVRWDPARRHAQSNAQAMEQALTKHAQSNAQAMLKNANGPEENGMDSGTRAPAHEAGPEPLEGGSVQVDTNRPMIELVKEKARMLAKGAQHE